MKKIQERKDKDELSNLKSYVREKAKQLWDEVVELIFCSLLSSHFMDHVIIWSYGTIIHDLLVAMQRHQNLAGFLKIAFPFLLFLIWRLIRYLATLLIQKLRNFQFIRRVLIRIDIGASPNNQEIAVSNLKTVVT